jgi:hypothetical protein
VSDASEVVTRAQHSPALALDLMAAKGFEKKVENLFDGLFSRAFKSSVKPLQIGRKLLQTVDAERDVDAQGRRTIPNTYVVQLSTHDREGFADIEPALVRELTEAVREYVRQEGYYAEGKVRVALRTNPDLRKGRFDISVRNNSEAPDAPASSAPNNSGDDAMVGTPLPSPVPPPITAPVTIVPDSAFDLPPAVITLPNGQRIALHEGHYVVGRNLECDIVISDPNVSRQHGEFVCAAGEVVVRDKNSTNGTKVNGVNINGDQLLQHGDVISFGTAQVKFEAS